MACVIQPLPVRLSAAPCASQGSSQPSSQAATPLYLSPHRRCCVVFVPSSAHGPSLLPPLSLSLGGAPCCAPSISAPFSSSGVFNITTWQADHLSPPPPSLFAAPLSGTHRQLSVVYNMPLCPSNHRSSKQDDPSVSLLFSTLILRTATAPSQKDGRLSGARFFCTQPLPLCAAVSSPSSSHLSRCVSAPPRKQLGMA